MAIKKIRNDCVLLDQAYEVLIYLGDKIQDNEKINAEDVAAYTNLLDIYFGITEDGF